jgi:DNA-binding response OmpR family regulator
MGSKRVVVIDNDRATLELMAEVLDSEGYLVTCYDARSFSALGIQRADPDVVIMELTHLDPSQALLVLGELRQYSTTSTVPVIVDSTNARLLNQLAEPLRRLGCTPLEKPFELEEFLSTIRGCLSAWPARECRQAC